MTGPLGDTRRPPTAVEAAERGATRIADRVVAKIAAQAAREALDTLPPDAVPPHATVVVHREIARVRVHLELGYPCDIGGHCNAVRRHVAERVDALTGMEVPEVTVQVERLHLVPAAAAVQGRTR
ncbi:Asp23/Gls24 family envelope stress response protein [Streptomyces sp. S1D4-11]|nr:Asp23/Gls24 family envelope stress response protein [Streptomyces sp. S1D4-11]QIY95070.1 Asp23/Gls24 family envelope stress response protein [Streptomyces sp. S1D4-11]